MWLSEGSLAGTADYPTPANSREPGPERECRRVLALVVVLGLAAGAALPFQAGVNAQLADSLGSPIRASLVSFVVGALVLAAVWLLFARGWVSAERMGEAPWWVWIGGALGAFYVTGAIVVAPRVGAATLIAVILAGQAVASLAIDHFGLVGFDEHPATAGRIAGLLLIAFGVLLVRLF
jgi:transporter family-2 protein